MAAEQGNLARLTADAQFNGRVSGGMSEFYEITNRITGKHFRVEAPSAQDACEKCRWFIADCHVRELRDGRLREAAQLVVVQFGDAGDELRGVTRPLKVAIEQLREVLAQTPA